MGQYWIDGLVLLAYFAVIFAIGFSQRSKSDSVEGFALGDRQTPWWAVLASILAAEISAATFIGAPESGYVRHNWTYAQFAIGTLLARIIVSYLFIPVFYRHGVVSLYEYLGTRFGKATRSFASATFLVTRVLAMGTRLYVSAIILVLAYAMWKGGAVTDSEKFWIFAVALVVITIATALYTAAGGIRAVIWTDFIQIGVLITALGFTIWFLLKEMPGGWETVSAQIKEPAFLNFAKPAEPGFWAWVRNVFTSDYTIWAAVIGSTFVTMATHGIDQDTVQRMLTAKNRKQSAFATIMSGVIDFPVVGAFIFIGVLLAAYYGAVPDPNLPRKASGELETGQVFPHFILTRMPHGVCGLVVAGLLATAMGSLSTALNALGTSFATDFVFPRVGEANLTEARRVRILRWSTALFAAFIVIVGLITAWYMAHNDKAQIIPLVLGILGFTFGSLLGVFLVAVLTKSRGNDNGNIIAMCCGFVAVLFLSNPFGIQQALGIGKPFILAFPWRVTLGTFVTVAIALCFATPADKIRDSAQA